MSLLWCENNLGLHKVNRMHYCIQLVSVQHVESDICWIVKICHKWFFNEYCKIACFDFQLKMPKVTRQHVVFYTMYYTIKKPAWAYLFFKYHFYSTGNRKHLQTNLGKDFHMCLDVLQRRLLIQTNTSTNYGTSQCTILNNDQCN